MSIFHIGSGPRLRRAVRAVRQQSRPVPQAGPGVVPAYMTPSRGRSRTPWTGLYPLHKTIALVRMFSESERPGHKLGPNLLLGGVYVSRRSSCYNVRVKWRMELCRRAISSSCEGFED
jgi:hypothetical protein